MQPDRFERLLDVPRIIADIEARGFAGIRSKWGAASDDDERRQKYLDLEYWIPANLRRVRRCGLDTGPKRRILDLGCGCGYFLYLCKLLGHEVLGVDRQEKSSLFVDAREALGVPWIPATIRCGESLPLWGSFSVVTAHMVTFNGHRVKPWGVKEWKWLIDEIPAPLWSIELNREPDGTLYPEGLREWFVAQGAEVQEQRVTLIDRPARR